LIREGLKALYTLTATIRHTSPPPSLVCSIPLEECQHSSKCKVQHSRQLPHKETASPEGRLALISSSTSSSNRRNNINSLLQHLQMPSLGQVCRSKGTPADINQQQSDRLLPLPTRTTTAGRQPASHYLQGSTQSDHSSSSQAHAPDDCPGCQADLEAVLKASEASALEETRLREQRKREEEEHWRAVQASEEEERRRAKAEEEELRLVLAASQRDEEEAQGRRLEQQRQEEEHRLVLLEESRQMALREDENRIRRAHAELLERSRREAEEVARLRRQEEERMYAIESAALEESRREMEEEWRRRDEEERAMAEYSRQGGKVGEAGYWQHLQQDQAYDLALEMNRNMSISNEGASSSRPSRRPLPPTPGLAALAAGVESPAAQEGEIEWDHADTSGESDEEDPFGDSAEAPPSYDDVRTDRPPEAPDSIPDHIRFAPPPTTATATHSNTLDVPFTVRSEKSPVSANATPRAVVRDLPIVSAQIDSLAAPTTSSNSLPAQNWQPSAKSVRNAESADTLGSIVAESSTHRALPDLLSVDSSLSSLSRTESHSTTMSSSHLSTDHTPSKHHRSIDPTSSSTTLSSTLSSAEASSTSSGTSLQQRTMKGTDFGYTNEPFSPNLSLKEGGSGKKYFPNVVTLKKVQASLKEERGFFTIRAPSWKMLLRALAWYGNTRIEAGPEEVADSSRSLKLRVEVEFVTPTKTELGTGKSADAWKTAHVSMCVSLFDLSKPKNEDGSSSSSLAAELKRSSRSLDASYLRTGSTRRVITLPSSQPPVLPLSMVRLAQHLHQAHVFSAACPSTSQTALHSPRDLTRAIDRHDINYMAKMQRLRKEAGQHEGQEASDARLKSSKSRLSEEEGEGGEEDDDEDDTLDSGAVEVFDGKEVSASSMSRMKAKMKRKLAKRSGDSNAVDQDLESWISECVPGLRYATVDVAADNFLSSSPQLHSMYISMGSSHK
jgi:hypothetical protein